MTSARLIEYRITRQLMRRREVQASRTGVDTLIKGLALVAGVVMVALVLPELLLPVFLLSGCVALGL